jgi:hypothetical protein
MDNNNNHSVAESKESGTKTAHEYIRNILPFSYRDCISCGNRTNLACIRCSYCYSCHWKKEKEERRLLEDKISEIFPSPLFYVRKNVPIDKEAKRQPLAERPRQLVVDVNGRTSEPICRYHGCDHKFSLHGSGSCKCKHPTNKALGIFMRFL